MRAGQLGTSVRIADGGASSKRTLALVSCGSAELNRLEKRAVSHCRSTGTDLELHALRETSREHRDENGFDTSSGHVVVDRHRAERRRSRPGAGSADSGSGRIAAASTALRSGATPASATTSSAARCGHAADSKWWRQSFSHGRCETISADAGWRRRGR